MDLGRNVGKLRKSDSHEKRIEYLYNYRVNYRHEIGDSLEKSEKMVSLSEKHVMRTERENEKLRSMVTDLNNEIESLRSESKKWRNKYYGEVNEFTKGN